MYTTFLLLQLVQLDRESDKSERMDSLLFSLSAGPRLLRPGVGGPGREYDVWGWRWEGKVNNGT